MTCSFSLKKQIWKFLYNSQENTVNGIFSGSPELLKTSSAAIISKKNFRRVFQVLLKFLRAVIL